jgi:hypothetical protein
MVQFKLVLYKSLIYPWFTLTGFIQESGLSMVQFKLVLYKSGLSMVLFKLVLYKSLVYPWFCLSWFYTRVWFIHSSV